MKLKTKLGLSMALVTVLVIGQIGFAAEDNGMDKGMQNMMNGNGMMQMMENGNMQKMMDAMDSPEGQKMMKACGEFMENSSQDAESKIDL